MGCALWLVCLSVAAQVELPSGKEIFIPKDLQGIDLQNPESRWSFHRMACTENFVIFWEKGFGDDLSNPPRLEGEPMQVDLPNLMEKLERFYAFYRDTLQFVKPGSKSERYRMMAMLCYSLEGTAYGGDYDKTIGALWVTPSRLQDKPLNCIAHELGHCFQSQIRCDGEGEAWSTGGFYEMTSQWMLWQVNPNWVTDERFHWEAFTKLTHKAFLHLDNIYNSPYVIEYWGAKRGLPFIAEIYRNGLRGEDPAMTYKRLTGLSQEEFCDELFDTYRHFINWDFERVRKEMRPYANQWPAPAFIDAEQGWQRIAPENAPENYGFNVIALPIPEPGEKVEVSFCGEAGQAGYASIHPKLAGWRYGWVAVSKEGKSLYGEVETAVNGTISYTTPEEAPAYLWLIVMGAPKQHWINPEDPWEEDEEVPLMKTAEELQTAKPGRPFPVKEKEPDAQWPYRIKVH